MVRTQHYNDYSESESKMKEDMTWYGLGMKTSPPIQNLARHYDVKLDTMRYWRKMLLRNPSWKPDRAHAIDQRIFTPEQGVEIIIILMSYVAKRYCYGLQSRKRDNPRIGTIAEYI